MITRCEKEMRGEKKAVSINEAAFFFSLLQIKITPCGGTGFQLRVVVQAIEK